eukprot:1137537-Pelagomonas_calceolata.AAC.1
MDLAPSCQQLQQENVQMEQLLQLHEEANEIERQWQEQAIKCARLAPLHYPGLAPHVYMPLLLTSSRRMTQFPGTDCGNTYTNARCPASLSPSLKTSTKMKNTSLLGEISGRVSS